MKNSRLLTTIAFTFMILMSFNMDAQEFDPLDKSPLDLASFPNRGSNKEIKVFYSRPYLKGRKIGTPPSKENKRGFVPFGKLWRTGANDATQIQFLKDFKFGGKTIKAGAYSLFTIPNEKEWTIIISSDVDNWATRGYKKSNEVARLTVPVSTASESLENLAMSFEAVDNGAHLHIGWDKIRVAVPFVKK